MNCTSGKRGLQTVRVSVPRSVPEKGILTPAAARKSSFHEQLIVEPEQTSVGQWGHGHYDFQEQAVMIAVPNLDGLVHDSNVAGRIFGCSHPKALVEA